MKTGKFDFEKPVWKEISNSAKKFIRRLLEFDPEKRYSSEQALSDKWIQKYGSDFDQIP